MATRHYERQLYLTFLKTLGQLREDDQEHHENSLANQSRNPNDESCPTLERTFVQGFQTSSGRVPGEISESHSCRNVKSFQFTIND